MMDFLNQKACIGGQYISFEKTFCGRKRPRKVNAKNAAWRTCGSWNNVHQVMESKNVSINSQETSVTELSDSSVFYGSRSMSLSSSCQTQVLGRRTEQKVQQVAPYSPDMSCSHALVNDTRKRWNVHLQPLVRCPELDALAQEHAMTMATARTVSHSNPKHSLSCLQTQPTRRLGENVAAGDSALSMHMRMLEDVTNYTNMVDGRYVEIGMGKARGSDGQYYLCQIYRG